MDTLGLEYFIFVVVTSLGVLQLAAANAGLSGFLFLRRRYWTIAFSVLAITWAFWWFFSVANRNHIGLAGVELFTGFSLGVLTAVALTLGLSSAIRELLRHNGEADPPGFYLDANLVGEGLEALRSQTYLDVAKHRRAHRKEYAEVVKR